MTPLPVDGAGTSRGAVGTPPSQGKGHPSPCGLGPLLAWGPTRGRSTLFAFFVRDGRSAGLGGCWLGRSFALLAAFPRVPPRGAHVHLLPSVWSCRQGCTPGSAAWPVCAGSRGSVPREARGLEDESVQG